MSVSKSLEVQSLNVSDKAHFYIARFKPHFRWNWSEVDCACCSLISKPDKFWQVEMQIGDPPNACQTWVQSHSAVDKSRDDNLC